MLNSDDFITGLNKKIFEYIEEKYKSGEDSFFDFNDGFSEEEYGRITRMKINRMNLTENGVNVLLDSIANLKKTVRKKQAETNFDIEALSRLIDSKRT